MSNQYLNWDIMDSVFISFKWSLINWLEDSSLNWCFNHSATAWSCSQLKLKCSIFMWNFLNFCKIFFDISTYLCCPLTDSVNQRLNNSVFCPWFKTLPVFSILVINFRSDNRRRNLQYSLTRDSLHAMMSRMTPKKYFFRQINFTNFF